MYYTVEFLKFVRMVLIKHERAEKFQLPPLSLLPSTPNALGRSYLLYFGVRGS